MSSPATARPLVDPALPARTRAQTSLLRVLAHPVRLQLVRVLLCDEETSVNDLAERLSTPQAIVSQQLRILRMSGLVDARRVRGFAFYRIARPSQRGALRGILDCSEKLTALADPWSAEAAGDRF